MASVPRIVAVDSSENISAIIRGAMILMDRQYILIEVPTSDAAIAELANSQVDLLVTAYALPDSTGTDLASRAMRESARTPIIVLAAPDDPTIDEETLEQASYTYMTRPVGELFLRALRVGLDGEAAVASQEASTGASTALDLGVIPDVDVSALRDNVLQIMRDVGAMGAFVADRLGRVVFSEGMTGYFDLDVCAATLAPHFAHTATLRDFIGDNAWSLQYFDGENYDLFGLSLGLHYFAVLIFDGGKRAAFGAVTNFGRKGADAIAELIGPEAWTYRRPVASANIRATGTQPVVVMEDQATQPLQAALKVAEDAPAPVVEERPALQLDALDDLDPDALFGQEIDESQFDELFTEADLSEGNIFVGGDNVSFDEAMERGILDE